MVFILGALVSIIAGGWLAHYLDSELGMKGVSYAWSLLRWPVVVLMAYLGFGWVYLLAPSYEERHWYWVAPGALTAVALWLGGSWMLKLYVAHINSFSGTYGSLGAIVVLMLWMYVISIALVLGGEVNIILESSAAEHGDQEASLRQNRRSAAQKMESSQASHTTADQTDHRKAA